VGKERVCARGTVWCIVCEWWATDAHGVHVSKLPKRVMNKDTGHVLRAP
jgi:hypothetical protein